jgi:hypothetical protein
MTKLSFAYSHSSKSLCLAAKTASGQRTIMKLAPWRFNVIHQGGTQSNVCDSLRVLDLVHLIANCSYGLVKKL